MAQIKQEKQQKKIASSGTGWLKFLILTLAITAIAFSPVTKNDFINFDDPLYVTENPAVQKLNPENVRSFFTNQFVGNYQPVVMLSYALQFKLFKMNAGGYHFFSLLFHLLNTALVFAIVFRLLKNSYAALITALLFGVHPLHVESVAWVAAQKDVFYSFFFFASIYFYIRNKDEGKAKFLILSLTCFILSVLSKAQAVVIPVVLILIDHFREGKFSVKQITSKTLHFALAVLFGLIAVAVQKKAGAVQDFGYFSLGERVLFASYGFVNYLWQAVLPLKLSIFYPYPETNDKINSNWVYIAPVIIFALTAVVWMFRKRSPVTVFGTLFFAVTIALVIQLIPVGDAIHADRYTYVSLLGLFIIAGYYFGKYFEERKRLRPALTGLAVVYFSAICWLTYSQTRNWKDSISIYTSSLKNHKAPIMYCNLGEAHFKAGKIQDALNDFSEAIKMKPRFPNAFRNRALVYQNLNDWKSAAADYGNALVYYPNEYSFYYFRANCFKNAEDYDNAIKDYTMAIGKGFSLIDSYYGRGEAYGRQGKLSESINDFTKVIQMNPKYDAAYNNRGIAYSMAGKFTESINDFNKAIELNPKFWNAFFNRSNAYRSMGDQKKALDDALLARRNGYPVPDDYLNALQPKSGTDN